MKRIKNKHESKLVYDPDKLNFAEVCESIHNIAERIAEDSSSAEMNEYKVKYIRAMVDLYEEYNNQLLTMENKENDE